MPDPTPAPAPAGTPPAPNGGTPPATWYEGKAEAEIIGHWQNRGLDLADPVKVAIEMTKAHRDAERHIGVPSNEILRMPKATATAAELASFWQRLGVPKEATEYDLSGVKFAGNDLDQGLVDAMRQTMAANYIPKDRAAPIVAAMVKWLEGQETSENAAAETKRAEQVAALDRLWGANKAGNMLAADQGARRLGVNSDEVKAISNVIGVDRAAEMFRKIGAGTREDTFVEGRITGAPATSEAAAARLAELQNDKGFSQRLLRGDVQARQEFDNLVRQSIGWIPDAA